MQVTVKISLYISFFIRNTQFPEEIHKKAKTKIQTDWFRVFVVILLLLRNYNLVR